MPAPATPPRQRERRGGVPVGRPLGIPVVLAPSWVLVVVLITWSVAPAFSHPRTPGALDYAAGAGAALLFAASVLAHELGHSAISLRLGIPIRRITLYLFGGVAEMEREPPTAAGEYLVAVAGPLVSVFLAATASAVARSTTGTPHEMAAYVAFTNGVLAVLNLLPGLPLDGGRVLRAGVWAATGDREQGTRAGVRGGQALALVAAAVGLLRLGAGDSYGLAELLIGAFLWTNATALGRRGEVMQRVTTLDAHALTRPALLVDAATPLSEALRRAVETGKRLLVVDSYGAPSGVINGPALAAVPEKRRPWVSVADVTRPIEPGLMIEDTLTGTGLLDRMRETPASEYVVTAPDGTIEGVLSAHDVARVLDGLEVPAT
jgi:Zn-dependent protease